MATNFEDRESDEPIEGTFVFSGVYYGWDEPGGFLVDKKLWFGRRYIGNSVYDADERDRFYVSLDGQEIMFEHNLENAIFGFADLTGGKMRGGFQPGEREHILHNRPLFNDYDDLGPGTWTAEKKSDDPNFYLPLYQVCASKHGMKNFSSHWCVKVSDVRADGSNRPYCAIGYNSGSITFLSGEKCGQLVRSKRSRID